MSLFLNVYGRAGRRQRSWGENTEDPTWEQIEAAIRRCDGGRYLGVAVIQSMDGKPDRMLSLEGVPPRFQVLYEVEDEVQLSVSGGAGVAETIEAMRQFVG